MEHHTDWVNDIVSCCGGKNRERWTCRVAKGEGQAHKEYLCYRSFSDFRELGHHSQGMERSQRILHVYAPHAQGLRKSSRLRKGQGAGGQRGIRQSDIPVGR